MSDKPILFSGQMVRAILDGRKTQTRRVLKSPTALAEISVFGRYALVRLGYAPGDRLWVRETWTVRMDHGWTIADARSRLHNEEILYRADGHDSIDGWWSSIHMPREFSRLTLAVTDVRVQRLQETSEDDARAEGIEVNPETGAFWGADGMGLQGATRQYVLARDALRDLWDSLNAKRAPWSGNPWVCALTFVAHRCNIDRMERSHE